MVAQALPHAAWAAPVSRRVPVFGTFGRFHLSVPRRPICRAGKRNAPPVDEPFLDCHDRHRKRQSNDRDTINLIGVEQAVSALRDQKGRKAYYMAETWLMLHLKLYNLQEGFLSGLLLIFFSEIGDKTFFVALLLALQRDRWTVFTGTFGALALMTVVSVALGLALHELDEVLPGLNALPLDDILAIVLLVVFGVQTLRDNAAEEKEEAEQAVSSMTGMGLHFAGDDWGLLLSTFTLVFAAEWGDKSFLATIALAASSSPGGVVAGAVTGHGLATAIAVVGGSFLSDYISEQVAAYVGGSLFLVFAAATTLQLVHGL